MRYEGGRKYGYTAQQVEINMPRGGKEKLPLSGLELGFVILESGALPACPFPAGTLISCRTVYLFVHCAHFIALSIPFHYVCPTSIYYKGTFLVLLLTRSPIISWERTR